LSPFFTCFKSDVNLPVVDSAMVGCMPERKFHVERRRYINFCSVWERSDRVENVCAEERELTKLTERANEFCNRLALRSRRRLLDDGTIHLPVFKIFLLPSLGTTHAPAMRKEYKTLMLTLAFCRAETVRLVRSRTFILGILNQHLILSSVFPN
jgi:hypothetical protein